MPKKKETLEIEINQLKSTIVVLNAELTRKTKLLEKKDKPAEEEMPILAPTALAV